MSDLETRFAQALRRALGTTEAGAPVVHVAAAAAPVVNISPRVEATLPALTEPVEVFDIGRAGVSGAYSFRMKVKRDGDGWISDVQVEPVAFFPVESFQ